MLCNPLGRAYKVRSLQRLRHLVRREESQLVPRIAVASSRQVSHVQRGGNRQARNTREDAAVEARGKRPRTLHRRQRLGRKIIKRKARNAFAFRALVGQIVKTQSANISHGYSPEGS